jgi:acetyltransferase-like isoleucine patch superfamily enzyme
MTEYEKAQLGYLYNADNDEELEKCRLECAEKCFDFNNLRPTDYRGQKEIFDTIFGKIKGSYYITQPFHCDYGRNISIGENFYSNFNLVILDGAKVTFGDNVFVAPNCVFSTAAHPIDRELRNSGLEIALPITVGNNVWIGANVSVLPGVTIGDDTIIGAGSVVNHNIPDGVVAVGVPCRVIRKITEADKSKYRLYKED